jgi:hypothetical protein
MNVQEIYHSLARIASNAANAGDQELAKEIRIGLELMIFQEREIAALRKTISGMKMERASGD